MTDIIQQLRTAVDTAEQTKSPDDFIQIRLLLNDLEEQLAPAPFIVDAHILRQSILFVDDWAADPEWVKSLNDMSVDEQAEWFKGVQPIEF